MKTRITLFLAVLFAASMFFTSCKKGDNDPALSLLSRKARLTGEWKLTAGSWSNVESKTNGDVYTDSYVYDSLLVYTTDNFLSGTHFGNTTTIKYSEKLTIANDYTFSYAEVVVDDDGSIDSTINSGYWYFLDKVKEEDVKNKERVEFLITEHKSIYVSKDGSTTTTKITTYSGQDNSNTMIFDLDRLANKEIIVLIDNKVVDGNTTTTNSGTKTYTQQ